MTIGAGSTLTFSSTQAAHGALSYQVGAIASQFTFGNLAQTSSATTALRFYIYTGTVFSTATVIWQVLTSANANISQVQINAAGKLIFTQTAGIVATALTALSINTWYRVEATINTTSGAWTFAYYAGDTLTASESFSGTGTFTALPVNHRIGKASNGAQVATFFMDDLAVSDTATTFLGPAIPTVTGSLGMTLGLTGVAVPVAAVTGSLGITLGLTAASIPVVTATGTLPIALGLTGAAVPVQTVSGTVPLTLGLTGTAIPSTTVTGTIPLTLGLTGTAIPSTTVTGTIPLAFGLVGTVGAIVPQVTGSLGLTLGLTATSTPVAGTTGSLGLTLGMVGIVGTNVATVTGQLGMSLGLTGAAVNVARVTGTLGLTIGLVGTVASTGPHLTYSGQSATPWRGSSAATPFAAASTSPWAGTSAATRPAATSTTLWKGTSGE